jgi:internalin A
MVIRLVGCIHLVVSITVIPVSLQAASPPTAHTFARWCQQRQSLTSAATNTIDSILNQLGTKDCQKAQTQLRSVTALRITELPPYTSKAKPTGKPMSYLSLDMPFTLDLQPIFDAMPNLRQLDLSNTLITNLAPIRSLTQLEDLNLANTQLQDVAPLAALTNLVHLNISRNRVQDISLIGKLKELEYFDFSYNQIRDLSTLTTLPKLFSIRLTNNPVDSSTCLGKWTSSCEN